jgi:3D (Asp-Asp-Asp) domain-containing protein
MRTAGDFVLTMIFCIIITLAGVQVIAQTNRQEMITHEIQLLRQEIEDSAREIQRLKNTLDNMDKQLDQWLNEWEVGEFEATAYTLECGNGDGYTATMTVPEEGRTIAVDPSVIPLGSRVYVEGRGWHKAEDTGGAIKGEIVDIYMEDLEDALSWGRRNVRVLWRDKDGR